MVKQQSLPTLPAAAAQHIAATAEQASAPKPFNPTARKNIEMARKELILGQPFFGVLALKLDVRERESHPTMRTDGRWLEYNPDWAEAAPNAELQAVIAHEVLHLGLGHHARGRGKDHQTWNEACDYAINGILAKENFQIPKGHLVNPSYDDMTEEQIYTQLMLVKPPSGGGGNGQGGGSGQPGGGQPGDGNDPDQDFGGTGEICQASQTEAGAAEAQQEWQQNAVEATRAAASAGRMPASLNRRFEQNRNRRAAFAELLRRFMNDRAKTETTWSNPNRRFIAGGLYMPGVRNIGMGRVVIGVDTSGSIGQEMLNRMGSVISEILEEVEPLETVVVYCDAAVQAIEKYAPGEPLRLKAKGGGGTAFEPVFKCVADEDLNPVAMIYLTDLCGPFPPSEPEFPVFWGAIGAGGQVAPWGETVPVED